MASWGSNPKYMSWILNFLSSKLTDHIYKGEMQSTAVVSLLSTPPLSSDPACVSKLPTYCK